MSWWKPRSHLQSADSQYSSSDDVTPGGVVNRSPSPPRKTRGKKASSDDYPSYAAADTNREGGYGGGYNDGYSGGGAPYGSGNRGVTLYGGGGYNKPPAYGNVSDGYNAPASWGAHDPSGRTPMYINTKEVHVWAPPNYEGDDQRRRGGGGSGGGGGGGGGFFRPALEAVGHFVDRRFGLDDRN
ncbi:unnamed protein product [Alopecurus aequalis]